MRRFCHGDAWVEFVVEGEEHGFRPGDGAEHGEDEVGQAVPVTVEGGDDSRVGCCFGEQSCVGGVDEDGLVRHVGVTRSGSVHFFFEHSFVDG